MMSVEESFLESSCRQIYADFKVQQVPTEKIPCEETSDMDVLCAEPLVSVRIITYNHEPYIRQCIESVLCQVTDFEYEIVIGEDCSTDKTREICFEYQKRYPEKIRVLWSEENVYKICGNQRRTMSRCRGEYLAIVEGDDYWIDPRKLQKQVDLMRRNKAIACVANYATLYRDGRLDNTLYRLAHGERFTHQDLAHFYPQTATYMVRREVYDLIESRFPNIYGRYDVIQLHCMIECGPVVFLPDIVSVYRITGEGIATSLSGQEKQLLAVKQYLDLYLHGPKSWHKRFGAAVMTYVAFFFNRSTRGWTREFTESKSKLLRQIFWEIYRKQLFDLRSLRAFLRYVRFRLGMTK